MFSDVIKAALEHEIVGQPRAVNSVVRGVTRVVSGLTPRERSSCGYLFIGPTGTGKTQMIQSLARILHGDECRMVVADCTHFVHGDPWMALTAQLAPVFSVPRFADRAVLETPPLSILRIEYLDRAPQEVSRALAVALETGHLMLPQGRHGVLRDCLVFLTSNICSREILDETTRIGFTVSIDDDESGDTEIHRVEKTCRDEAEKQFGGDLLARLDGVVVFHRLQEEDLSGILDRRLARLNDWLAARRGFRCELRPEAREFLLARGRRDLRVGARDLIRAHRRFVEFPLADLLVSGRIPGGALVLVERLPIEEHLHFTVTRPSVPQPGPQAVLPQEIPVVWEEAQQPA